MTIVFNVDALITTLQSKFKKEHYCTKQLLWHAKLNLKVVSCILC